MADATGWQRLAASNAAAGFIDASLRGSGQVIFQDNPLTGILFLAAILWGAAMAGTPAVAAGAVIGLVVATATAMLLNADAASLRQGMFGFNGVLVGAAVPTFLAATPAMWVLLVIGAAVSTVAMLAISNVMKTWGTPALTFPFVLTTWFLMLAAYSFGAVSIAGMGPPALASGPSSAAAGGAGGGLAMLEAWLKGPAQVFLIDNWVSGLLVLAGLAIASPWAAGFALLGSAVALLFSAGLGAGANDISAGLYGFSPVLTSVAVGCVFYRPSWRVTLYALLATAFTVIVQGALDAALAPLGIPSFTAPFVFVTWLFLLPKARLQPHPHAPITDGIVGEAEK